MNIYLIGYRCTGKTSVGRMLAEKLDRRFIDSDRYIVEKTGMSISEIVADHGWEYFRQKEKQTLAELNRRNQLVLATGGGIVLDPDNQDALKDKKNFVIWLQASPKTIYNRMKNDRQSDAFRPALTKAPIVQEITKTLAERTPYYESVSDFVVKTDGLTSDEVCKSILKLIRERH